MATDVSEETVSFTPSEVAAIAGVSVGLQREWRRHNILPKKDDRGWTRVEFGELVRIYALKLLAESGLPLREASSASGQAAEPLLSRLAEDSREANFWRLCQLATLARSEGRSEPVKTKRHAAPYTHRYSIVWQEQHGDTSRVNVKPAKRLDEVPEHIVVWSVIDNYRAAARFAHAAANYLPDAQEG